MNKRAFRPPTILACLVFSLGLFPWPGIAADNPEFRPALIGTGPEALPNLIATKELAARGQGDGVVMFTAIVTQTGFCFPGMVYRGTPGSELLQKEVFRALGHARFIPAIYQHKSVGIEFRGTVMYFAGKGSPRLRVFASQNPEELAQQKDFVAPQLLAVTDNWKNSGEEVKAAVLRKKNGAAELALQISRSGKVLTCKVEHEDPPGYHFGEASCHALQYAQFNPGYRDGHVVDCTFQLTEFIRTVRVFGPRS